jgi:protein-tyrosine phosphatase
MTYDVLMVCTGNIARSPMAELLLRHRLGDAAQVRVRSAGTWGHEGSLMERNAAAALAEIGIDDGGFRARELTAAMVADATLVLTATREHRVAVVSLDPAAVPRTFTLREFALLLRHLGPVPGPPTSLVAAAAGARGAVRVRPADIDVADPFGSPMGTYRRCRDVIAGAVDVIAPALQPPTGLQ